MNSNVRPLRALPNCFGPCPAIPGGTRRRFLLTASRLVFVVFLLCCFFFCRATNAEPPKRPLLVAHYMPWFEADPKNKKWGWHWTMNAFDPERITDSKRNIASHYYPLIGPYDSSDPAVIEYHLLLMKMAGIDGIIVDWYGLSDFADYPTLHRNTAALVKSAAMLGLRVGICYEDQTISKRVEVKKLPAGERIAQARREIQWLRENWFSNPAYLKLNGAPVLLSFGSAGLSDAEWEQAIRPADGPLIYLSEHRQRSAASGTFDWPQPRLGLAAVDTYYRESEKGKNLRVPAVFPRFHDIYKEAKIQESYGRIPDDQGKTFAITLARAQSSGAALVQIATWNDWGEGTIIEPSQEFGYRDLETIQRLRRASDPAFAATPDDLRLPYRLWALRSRQGKEVTIARKLDALAGMLASGNLAGARAALQAIETPLKSH